MTIYYNPEVKEAFLNNYDNEQTRLFYSYAFKKGKEIEEYYKKDIYDFNLDQIKEVLLKANPSTKVSALTNGNIISSYITFAIENGYTSNINILDTINKEWFYEGIVDKDKKLFYSEKEIVKIEERLVNAQDAVIVRLIFEGVFGHRCSEISNLKVRDVNFETGELSLKDNKYGTRTTKVSERCLNTISQAVKQPIYYKLNGLSSSKAKERDLEISEFVVRNIQTSYFKPTQNIDRFTVYRRLAMIKDVLELPSFTAKNIERSGMIKEAQDILNGEQRELTKEETSAVADKFSIKKLEINNKYEYNFANLIDFLNLDVINQLYGDTDI